MREVFLFGTAISAPSTQTGRPAPFQAPRPCRDRIWRAIYSVRPGLTSAKVASTRPGCRTPPNADAPAVSPRPRVRIAPGTSFSPGGGRRGEELRREAARAAAHERASRHAIVTSGRSYPLSSDRWWGRSVTVERADGGGSGERREALGTIARATLDELRHTWSLLDPEPQHEFVRPPEAGMVMVRGRIGGGGAPFNLGEATVTRAVARLKSGAVGYATVLGRDLRRAGFAALLDAAWQTEAHRDLVEADLLGPVRARLAASSELTARRTAATKVAFFTLVRGEDEP
ncbi:MAG: phosphonate C-P lyase system protein PhnG [Bauldia sp.]|nr:phosphonate C-P lyase system protein PhnG [Bauldia sp.]